MNVCMDNTATACNGSTMITIQNVGGPVATPGGFANRADHIGSLTHVWEGSVNVYPYNQGADTDDPEKIGQALGSAPYLFKSGEMVVRRWGIISNCSKQTYWVRAAKNENPFVEQETTEKFRRYYTVSQNNYPLEGHRHLPNATVIGVDARK